MAKALTADRQTFWAQLSEPRHVTSMLLFYALLNFVLRLGLSPNYLPGEAEQALFAQTLHWGYLPAHPPLTTWLTWAVMVASAQSHAVFFFFREAMVALALIAYLSAGRIVIGDTRVAALATFALITTFTFGWLAHTFSLEAVTLTLMLALYMRADAQVIARGAVLDYVILGVVTGLGVLTSYVFLILPIALSLALIAVPRFLARLKALPLLLALGIAIAIVAPYEILGQIASSVPEGKDIARSAGILAVHLVGLVLPYALIFPFLFRNTLRPISQGEDEQRAWLRLYDVAMPIAAGAVIVLLFVLDFRALKAPWFYSAAMLLPMYLFLRARIAGWAESNGKIFVLIVIGTALLSMGGRIAVYETQGEHCTECSQWWPMHEYQDSLARVGFQQGTIVTPSVALAGNLRSVFNDARVMTPGFDPQTFGGVVDGQCLVVWEGNGPAPNDTLAYLASALHANPRAEAERGNIFARLNKTKGHMDPMNYMLLPPGSCK